MNRSSPSGTWRALNCGGLMEHVGPVLQCMETGALAIQVGSHHSNVTHRLHGGMMMALQAMAMKRLAHSTAIGNGSAACPTLVSYHCDLLDSCCEGDWVVATSRLVRSTRTAMFATGELLCGDRVLMNSTAVYRRDERLLKVARAACSPPSSRAYQPMVPAEAFSAHMGPIDESYDDSGDRFGAIRIRAIHLCPVSRVVAADGVLLFLSDIFLGRHAKVRAGMPCVTVGMTVSSLGNALLGDLVEIETEIVGMTDHWVMVRGMLSAGGVPIVNVDSLWKAVGEGPVRPS